MTETKPTYHTAAEIAAIDAAEREADRAGDAIRAERALVRHLADMLLRTIAGVLPAQDECTWRCAMQDAYERLGEIRTNNPV